MIGERLHFLRKEQGMTQQALADALKVSKYTISSYESGKTEPSDEIKVAIAREFNVSLDYLLGSIDDPISYNRLENAILLPEHLAAEMREQVELYVEFLLHKRNQASL